MSIYKDGSSLLTRRNVDGMELPRHETSDSSPFRASPALPTRTSGRRHGFTNQPVPVHSWFRRDKTAYTDAIKGIHSALRPSDFKLMQVRIHKLLLSKGRERLTDKPMELEEQIKTQLRELAGFQHPEQH